MRDIQFLSDAGEQVIEVSYEENFSVGANRTYGTIINPDTRKRARRAGASPPPEPAKPQPKPQVKQETKPTINIKAEPPKLTFGKPTANKPTANTTAKKVATTSAPTLKRQGSSGGIGQMFAKQASKPKKPAAPKPKEEAPAPALSDEGEGDDEPMPEAKQAAEEDGKSRRDRQAELRRMMDESDGEEDGEESKSRPESPADEPMDEDPAPPEPEAKSDEGPAEVVASTGDGRRRGRRRVMKKKQIMDDQGYLGEWQYEPTRARAFIYSLHLSGCMLTTEPFHQSPYKSRAGSLSPRRRRRHRNHRRRSPRRPRRRHQLPSRRRRRPRARGTSCPSSARNETRPDLLLLLLLPSHDVFESARANTTPRVALVLRANCQGVVDATIRSRKGSSDNLQASTSFRCYTTSMTTPKIAALPPFAYLHVFVFDGPIHS